MAYKYKKRRYRKRYRKGRKYYKRKYGKGYKKRYYNKIIKSPEIHKSETEIRFINGAFDHFDDGVHNYIGCGYLTPLTRVSYNEHNQTLINGIKIQGRKIFLKYIYIKGYYYNAHPNVYGNENNFLGRLGVYIQRQNINNQPLDTSALYDNNPLHKADYVPPDNADWTLEDLRNILYKVDYKPDTYRSVKKYHKNIFFRYDNANNTVPFKKRIIVNKVVEIDDDLNEEETPSTIPSRNACWMNLIFPFNNFDKTAPTDPNRSRVEAYTKVSLYWTDY